MSGAKEDKEETMKSGSELLLEVDISHSNVEIRAMTEELDRRAELWEKRDPVVWKGKLVPETMVKLGWRPHIITVNKLRQMLKGKKGGALIIIGARADGELTFIDRKKVVPIAQVRKRFTMKTCKHKSPDG